MVPRKLWATVMETEDGRQARARQCLEGYWQKEAEKSEADSRPAVVMDERIPGGSRDGGSGSGGGSGAAWHIVTVSPCSVGSVRPAHSAVLVTCA